MANNEKTQVLNSIIIFHYYFNKPLCTKARKQLANWLGWSSEL